MKIYRGKKKKPAPGGKLKKKVWERDKYICYYCNFNLKGMNTKEPTNPVTVDHRIPLSSGGENTLGNLVTACRDCNGSKKNMPEEVFLRSQKLF